MSAKLINEKKTVITFIECIIFFCLFENICESSRVSGKPNEKKKKKKNIHSCSCSFRKKTGTQKWPDINLWYTRVRLNSFDWNERTQYYIYIYNQRQQHLNWFNSQIESFWDCRLIEDCGDFSAYTVCNATQSGKCMVRV